MKPLHFWFAQSNFSFLKGASYPHELVNEAASAGYSGICITDFDGFYGLVKAWLAQKQQHENFKVHYGAQININIFEQGIPCKTLKTSLERFSQNDLPVFLQNRLGYVVTSKSSYAELCLLASQSHSQQKQATPISFRTHTHWPTQAIAILPQRGISQLFSPREKHLFNAWKNELALLKEIHTKNNSNNFFLAITPPTTQLERNAFENHIEAHKTLNIPLIATGDAFFHTASQKNLHDALTAIRLNKPISEIPWACFSNSERRIQKEKSLRRFFEQSPTLINAAQNNLEIANHISFTPAELRYRYPNEFLPHNHTPISFLTSLVQNALCERFGNLPPTRLLNLVNKEIALVNELEFSDYFLTVWDIVRFARSQNILCQGRGSAANSAICFLLGITAVDPMVSDVLFERFISKERGEPPDIDVDFEHERREEVIQYIYNRYGRNRAAMVANVITFRSKGSIRGSAKALGINEDRAIQILHRNHPLEEKEDPVVFENCTNLAGQIKGFPRHLGIHSGGFVIAQEPLTQLTPIEPATMPGRSVIQWNKDDIESLGFFKIDILALGMLTALRKTFALLAERNTRAKTTLVSLAPTNLQSIPSNCAKTYKMIREAKTTGVFQIESRAQMSILPKILPREFYDLVVSIGIVRPGPIVSGMVRSYVARRTGKEQATYPDPRLKSILARTLGVPIFQEQVMRVAMTVANFTPGEADELRRAMGAWKLNGNMKQFENKLRLGMKENSIPEEFANIIFKQIEGFSQYGFPESHATSFAFLAYASAWLKAHFPTEFLCGLLNSQPLGFYSAHSLLQEAKHEGVQIENPCLFSSNWDSFITNNGTLQLGFRTLSNIREDNVNEFLLRRAKIQTNTNSFDNAADFDASEFKANSFEAIQCFSSAEQIRLAMAGCFHKINTSRRDILWKLLDRPSKLVEENQTYCFGTKPDAFEHWDNIQDDFKHKGYAIENHPIAVLKSFAWPFPIPLAKIVTASKLKTLAHNQTVHIAGLVMVRQRPPTAKGMLFITLEDETGTINLIIRPQVQEQFQQEIFGSDLFCCAGIRQSNGADCTIVVKYIHSQTKSNKSMSDNSTPMPEVEKNISKMEIQNSIFSYNRR